MWHCWGRFCFNKSYGAVQREPILRWQRRVHCLRHNSLHCLISPKQGTAPSQPKNVKLDSHYEDVSCGWMDFPSILIRFDSSLRWLTPIDAMKSSHFELLCLLSKILKLQTTNSVQYTNHHYKRWFITLTIFHKEVLKSHFQLITVTENKVQ